MAHRLNSSYLPNQLLRVKPNLYTVQIKLVLSKERSLLSILAFTVFEPGLCGYRVLQYQIRLALIVSSNKHYYLEVRVQMLQVTGSTV